MLIKATNRNAIRLCLPSLAMIAFSWNVEMTVASVSQTPMNNQYPMGKFPASMYKIDAVNLLTIIMNIEVPEMTTGSNSKANKIGFKETPPPRPAAEAIIPTTGAKKLAVTTRLTVHLLSVTENSQPHFSLRFSSFLAIFDPITATDTTATAYIKKTLQSPSEHLAIPIIDSTPLEPCNRAVTTV